MSHLCEDENPVIKFLQFGENSIKKLKFSWRPEYPVMEADVIVIL